MDQDKKTNSRKKRSPEKLREYIRIGSIGGYLVIAFLVLLAVSLIVWGFAGRIPVTARLNGAVAEEEKDSNTCLCFVDVNENLGTRLEGRPVTVTMPDGKTFTGTVNPMDDEVLSAEEVLERCSSSGYGLTDWLLSNILGSGKYFYTLTVETEEDISAYWHQLCHISIILSEVRPISFLLGS